MTSRRYSSGGGGGDPCDARVSGTDRTRGGVRGVT